MSGWGGGPGAWVQIVGVRDAETARAAIAGRASAASGPGAISRGMGRSYGDAAQLRDGLVFDLSGCRGISLDARSATVTAGAGVTIGELLDEVVPWGWMVQVLPGTQHVSMGGAIASDIHGKNHGTVGTFGSHVLELGLMTADGELHTVAPGERDGLFEATLGGMGLTGMILWARLALRRVRSAMMSVDTDRVASLDEAFVRLGEPGGPHRVAWIDLLGAGLVRGVVTRAEHAEPPLGSRPAKRAGATVSARVEVPGRFPRGLLHPAAIRAFNELRFRIAPRRERGKLESLGVHMFPLDALAAWPRLYGPDGFLQYQFVVPGGQEQIIEQVIELLRRRRIPTYLAVLKDFGPANRAPLSFPVSGWTLALDLPRGASGVEAALQSCDELVAQAEGRVYLSKDARLRADTVAAMYPRLSEWRAVRDRVDPDGLWRSDLALRTGLVGPRG
ncbi:MAG: FAD-binding protein [Solirubrobacteraceae bacterium]